MITNVSLIFFPTNKSSINFLKNSFLCVILHDNLNRRLSKLIDNSLYNKHTIKWNSE
jgi:hypothetical protein